MSPSPETTAQEAEALMGRLAERHLRLRRTNHIYARNHQSAECDCYEEKLPLPIVTPAERQRAVGALMEVLLASGDYFLVLAYLTDDRGVRLANVSVRNMKGEGTGDEKQHINDPDLVTALARAVEAMEKQP